ATHSSLNTLHDGGCPRMPRPPGGEGRSKAGAACADRIRKAVVGPLGGLLLKWKWAVPERFSLIGNRGMLGLIHPAWRHVGEGALAMSAEQTMKGQPSTIIVIDDDPDIRDSLGSLLRSVGFQVNLLGSVGEFLESGRPEGPTCLVLDVRLPGQS